MDLDGTSIVLVTGASGMVGRALLRRLQREQLPNVLSPDSEQLDLRDADAVRRYLESHRVTHVFHLAGRVGGIAANIKEPYHFLFDNLAMAANVIEGARQTGVGKLLNLGSSCIYPRECTQPMKEEYLLTGRLEPTNEGYALGKIAGLKLCEYAHKQFGCNFISLMPPNLYGLHDHFEIARSHVISGLITKFHRAKRQGQLVVEVWGTGQARREFLFVDDVADAMVYFMTNYDAEDLLPFVNVGANADVSIADLARLIADTVEYTGAIVFDTSRPEGMPQKLLDSSRARELGWQAQVPLAAGLQRTVRWYEETLASEG